MTNLSHSGSVRLSALLAFVSVLGCQNKIPPPEPERPASINASAAAPLAASSTTAPAPTSPSSATSAAPAGSVEQVTSAAAEAPKTPSAPATPAAIEGDPLQGKFTLEDATKGLPKTGKLVAELVTDSGSLKCEMYEDKAPNTVANFVGLARGIRPFKDPKTGVWVKRPAYDNGVFHRIIKGFMIQGGDPTGTGATDGGYVIPDEVWPGATHDRRGLICMANRGKNTNSMQFFITDAAAKHLDGGYTIFGSCGPDAVIEKLAAAEVRGDRAINPPKIKKVTVKRVK